MTTFNKYNTYMNVNPYENNLHFSDWYSGPYAEAHREDFYDFADWEAIRTNQEARKALENRIDKNKEFLPKKFDKKLIKFVFETLDEADHEIYEKAFGYTSLHREATRKQRSLREEVSKASFFRNRHTLGIIFILDENKLDMAMWNMIFNAVVNGKLVFVKLGEKRYQNLAYGSDEFYELSNMFFDKQKDERSHKIENWVRQSKLARHNDYELWKQDASDYFDFQAHTLSPEKMAMADILARLWALEPAQSEEDYQILMETINQYILAQIPTEEIFVGDIEEEESEHNNAGREIIRQIHMLPQAVKEMIQPLLNIQYTSVETYGNEALLDAVVLG